MRHTHHRPQMHSYSKHHTPSIVAHIPNIHPPTQMQSMESIDLSRHRSYDSIVWAQQQHRQPAVRWEQKENTGQKSPIIALKYTTRSSFIALTAEHGEHRPLAAQLVRFDCVGPTTAAAGSTPPSTGATEPPRESRFPPRGVRSHRIGCGRDGGWWGRTRRRDHATTAHAG